MEEISQPLPLLFVRHKKGFTYFYSFPATYFPSRLQIKSMSRFVDLLYPSITTVIGTALLII